MDSFHFQIPEFINGGRFFSNLPKGTDAMTDLADNH